MSSRKSSKVKERDIYTLIKLGKDDKTLISKERKRLIIFLTKKEKLDRLPTRTCLKCRKFVVILPMVFCSSECRRTYNDEERLQQFLLQLGFNKKSKDIVMNWYKENRLPQLKKHFKEGWLWRKELYMTFLRKS